LHHVAQPVELDPAPEPVVKPPPGEQGVEAVARRHQQSDLERLVARDRHGEFTGKHRDRHDPAPQQRRDQREAGRDEQHPRHIRDLRRDADAQAARGVINCREGREQKRPRPEWSAILHHWVRKCFDPRGRCQRQFAK
jgi:hypothetical protein